MPSLLATIARFFNADLTGRTWTRQILHPYFGEMTYFGSVKAEDCYWESEVDVPNQSERVGVTMSGTPDGPTAAEEQFCRSVIADSDLLLEQCRAAFEPELKTWAKCPLPKPWQDAFKLDGFEIPRDADRSNPWTVCYFVESAGHYFTAHFESGMVSHVSVDG